MPLEDVQHLDGHVDPRTTHLSDRSGRKVTRNLVVRISITLDWLLLFRLGTARTPIGQLTHVALLTPRQAGGRAIRARPFLWPFAPSVDVSDAPKAST